MGLNHYCVAALANITAAQARIESMKAANTMREQNGESLAYGPEAFDVEASHLEDIARNVNEWGWQ